MERLPLRKQHARSRATLEYLAQENTGMAQLAGETCRERSPSLKRAEDVGRSCCSCSERLLSKGHAKAVKETCVQEGVRSRACRLAEASASTTLHPIKVQPSATLRHWPRVEA